jgi:hypothetical protein
MAIEQEPSRLIRHQQARLDGSAAKAQLVYGFSDDSLGDIIVRSWGTSKTANDFALAAASDSSVTPERSQDLLVSEVLAPSFELLRSVTALLPELNQRFPKTIRFRDPQRATVRKRPILRVANAPSRACAAAVADPPWPKPDERAGPVGDLVGKVLSRA